MKYTDAHCHIFSAPAGNITGQVCNATTAADWGKLTRIADDRTHVCIGIHPWYIDSAPPDWADCMREILLSNPQIMVGEIGIDKYHPDIDRQIEFFAQQIEIAIEMNRPVHLHCVGAWDKVLHILKGHRPRIPIIAHAFGGNTAIMTALAEYNTYFSYGMRGDHIADTAKIAPADKILVESDSDTSTAQAEILATATREIAKLRGCDVRELNEQINKNFTGVINYAG
jgi:TatD DNase family protein